MASRAALLPEILDIVTLLAEAQADEDDAAEQARSAGRFDLHQEKHEDAHQLARRPH